MFRVVIEDQNTFAIKKDSEHTTLDDARKRFWKLTADGVVGCWIINVETGEIL